VGLFSWAPAAGQPGCQPRGAYRGRTTLPSGPDHRRASWCDGATSLIGLL